MPRKQIDGIIEAVRYAPDGKIALVRAYERRGSVWSDHLLLQRAELVERLAGGRKFFTGQRQTYFGSRLQAREAVRIEDQRVVAGGAPGAHDLLNGVPIF